MIAVDAMGGDHAPREVIVGALDAAKKGIAVLLCGDLAIIEKTLASVEPNWRSFSISIEDCTQTIRMDEDPSRAVMAKKDSSLIRAVQAVASGRAHAFVSAGNSGAVLMASSAIIGRTNGVLRPAVGSFIPTHSDSIFCLDLGVNAQTQAEHLVQFAFMGHVYVSIVKQMARPRIALLSNGHEPYKGTPTTKSAYQLLKATALNFVGNLEARELFKDTADILVCDGFAGNVLLKSIQGTADLLFTWLKQEARSSWKSSFLLWLNKGIFKKLMQKSDYAATGGALLLGVKQPVVLAHGRSSASAIKNAIRFAQQVIDDKRVITFNQKLAEYIKPRSPIPNKHASLTV